MVTNLQPSDTVDARTVLIHCQNVAYAAAKVVRDHVAESQNGAKSREQEFGNQPFLTRGVVLAAGLEARTTEFLRSKCARLSVQLTKNNDAQTNTSAAHIPPLAVSELPFHCDVPEHFRSISRKEIEVLVHVGSDPHAIRPGGSAELYIVIGITIARRSVACVFCRSIKDEPPVVAVLDGGLQNMQPGNSENAATEDSKTPVLVSSCFENGFDAANVLKCIGPCVTLEGSSFVEQSLTVASGKAHLCIWTPAVNSSVQAGMEAIISASGGQVTDVFGNKFQYRSSESHSGYGFIASSKSFAVARGKRGHWQICHTWRKAMAFDHLLGDSGLIVNEHAQATDIALDTAGNAMTAAWLSKILGREVLKFEARESTAVRYLMSNACRLYLKYEQSRGEESRNVFVKRVAMDELEHVRYKMKMAPHKLSRDVRSYQVEAAFLKTAECKRFRTDRTRIVTAHYIESDVAAENVPAMFSRFLFVLEDFGEQHGWYQSGLLGYDESIAAMDALASFHAFFWNGREMDGYEDVKKSVWSQATYWLPSRQASDCFEKLAQYWNAHRERFGDVFDDVASVSNVIDAENFGEMLERYAMGSAEIVHGYGLHEEHNERTLIHGDAKAANMFFRRTQGGGGDSVDLEVGLIDLQWCGWGHAGVDVAYVMACAVDAEVLGDDSMETKILEEYYERLVKYLASFEKTRDEGKHRKIMEFGNLKRVYEEAIVDLTRVVVGYHWVRIAASVEVLEERATQMGSNSYNKSVACARWLIGRCARILADKCLQEEGRDWLGGLNTKRG
ncbi:unnamed protein product [Agarophyton chilense]|eukprot:gb/GEZJ01003727.1/.p1 GENE.gb/GEZJ01003727.1/~~gb/GEZJ01003727.1/.p1  ORF type:complete len:788 (+),score=102.23 gb/GEZJ01003727.1/:186-2549(+)